MLSQKRVLQTPILSGGFPLSCVKTLGNPTELPALFALRNQKSSLKIPQPEKDRILKDFGAEDVARRTPCEDDKPKDAEIMPFRTESGSISFG